MTQRPRILPRKSVARSPVGFLAFRIALGTTLLGGASAGCSKDEGPRHSHSTSTGGAAGAPNVGPRPDLEESEFEWNLPKGFPKPWDPKDNPTTKAKVELGRHLFYDTRLSVNGEQSCASCHKQELAFTDGKGTATGTTGMHHSRGSMGLANVAYASTLTWGNPLLVDLENQALVPLFGSDPIELGLRDEEDLLARIADESKYEELFEAAFPDEERSLLLVTRALGAFQRTLISGSSPYDQWIQGQGGTLSDAERRGYALFNSEKMECFHCHASFNFTDHVDYADKAFFEAPYHNNALYNVDGKGAYPEPNTGVHAVTLKPADMGRFKAPSLRNIAVTAPYMHDGSIATLSEVLDHYAAAGRTLTEPPHAGNGSTSPLKDSFIIGFTLSDEERADVLAFFETLTDREFLTNPAFSNPWPE